jgi:hypothetical protein
MTTDNELFQIYVQTCAKVRAGTKLTNADYRHKSLQKYTTEECLAVSMAVQDVLDRGAMRAPTEFLGELKRLKS